MTLHLGCDDLWMQRAAGFVDVAAVGAGMRDDDLAAKIREELRSDRRGGSVGAVDDDASTIERETRNSGKQEANVLGAVGLVDLWWNALLRRASSNRQVDGISPLQWRVRPRRGVCSRRGRTA